MSWAEVDQWRDERRDQVREVEAAERSVKRVKRVEARDQVAVRRARFNVTRWFRELPAEMVAVLGDAPAAAQLLVANDWLLENGFTSKTRRIYRTLSAGELAMLKALRGCRFAPASFAKRFVRELADLEITDRQAGVLRKLVTVFRRQIPPAELLEADRHLLAPPPKKTAVKPSITAEPPSL